MYPTFELEKSFWEAGKKRVLGIDEVGRGALAGPFVLAGVIFDDEDWIDGVRDSKLISKNKREDVAHDLRERVRYEIAEVSHRDVDRLGLTKSFTYALRQIVEKMPCDIVVIDGSRMRGFGNKFHFQHKADRDVMSVAAASVIAKVYRDDKMIDFAQEFPEYGFDRHKGYGSAEHRACIKKLGPCPIHRRSFKL